MNSIPRRVLVAGFLGFLVFSISLAAALMWSRADNSGKKEPLRTTDESLFPTHGSPGELPETPPASAQFTPTPPATFTPTATTTLSPTPTITASPTPLRLSFCDQTSGAIPIRDYETITDSFALEFDGQILDLDLEIDLQHTYVGDLKLALEKVDGPRAQILDRPGEPPLYCPQDNIVAVFDDESEVDSTGFCAVPPPALTGRLRPAQPLGIFDGIEASGIWRITLSDVSKPDEGQLHSWCLVLTIR